EPARGRTVRPDREPRRPLSRVPARLVRHNRGGRRTLSGLREPALRCRAESPKPFHEMERAMIGKILGAALGRKLAGPDDKGEGTMLGFFAPAVAKRVVAPLGLAFAGGYVAKKLWDWRKDQKAEA